MLYKHKNLASGEWFNLSLAEQLGNIGSEIERAIAWHVREDQKRFQAAFERMLELIDLTLEDKRWQGPKRREVARLREELCGLFLDVKADEKIFNSIKKNFLYYGILARAHR